MNWTFIVIAAVMVGCVLIMYYYFSYSRTTLYNNQVLLNNTNTSISLAPVTDSPNSLNYTISLWVFLINWNSDGNYNTLLNMNTVQGGSSSTTQFNNGNAANNYILYLDKMTPNLYWYVPSLMSNSGDILVTNNFPIQSWTFVALSMNGNQGDLYINGKLVSSKNISTGTILAPGGKIELGFPKNNQLAATNATNNPNMYIANVKRLPSASNPQDVWTSYLAGNQVSNLNVSSYGAQVGLKQNGQVISQYNLN